MNTTSVSVDGLAQVKAHFKTLAAVAVAAGVKNWQSVQQWREVPPQYVLPICKSSAWELTPHQLRPDLYPYPQDAMPDHLRGIAA